MTEAVEKQTQAASSAAAEAMDALLWFGASMLRAGNTAYRTRQWMSVLARKMGFDAVSVSLTFDGITVSARRRSERVTAMREAGPAGVNVERIGALEQLAKTAKPGIEPSEVTTKLKDIEAAPHRYSDLQISVAVGVASGGFAFLVGGGAQEMLAAAIGGGIGQWLRSWLTRRHVNHYGGAALSAIAASGIYVLVAVLAGRFGLEFPHYPAGFIASVLFLVPGFPLIAALLDLLQYQTVSAVSRFAYGTMILLAVALGLSIVIAAAGIELSRQPAIEIAYPIILSLRAVASFLAASAFAMLFNSSARTILAAGFLALGANSLRLVLHDAGLMLAPAAFFAALTIGLAALLVERRFDVPRMAMVVAPVVIMMPGLQAFAMIVLFNRGQMLDALQASATCGFVIGALAMGLATARFFDRRADLEG